MSLQDQDFIQNLIRNYNRRLQKLKEKQALQGLDVKPDILLEIEDIEEKIENLQAELLEIENREEVTSLTKATISSAVRRRSQKAEENKRIEAQLAEITAQLANLIQKESSPSESPKHNKYSVKEKPSAYIAEMVVIPTPEIKRIESELTKITAWLANLVQTQYKQKLSANAIGIIVIATFITSLPLDVESADIVKSELKWLFTATDHFLKIRQGQREVDQPIQIAIPPYADGVLTSNNAILPSISDSQLQKYEKLVENIILKINHHLEILNFEWDRETDLAGGDATIKNSINSQLKEIIKNTEQLAEVMNSIYGIMVHSPGGLANLLS